MATVLAYTSPALGHINPLMPVLLALAGRGHDVHVRTLRDFVGMVREQGLTAEAIDARIEPLRARHPDWTARTPVHALRTNAALFTERAQFDGPDLQRAIDEVEPDVLIVDINAWGALAAAQAQERPWVQFAPYLPPIASRSAPPFGPGLIPKAGPAGRLRDAIARRLVMGAVEREFTPRLSEVRARFGLGPVDRVEDFLLACPRMIVTSSPPFDYERPDWPEHVRLIGGMSWEAPASSPGWLDEIEGPITLVTTSSEYQADEALARAAIDGLAGEPGSVVITMPAGASDFGALPPNVRLERFVPHSHVLARAEVAVTHGGMGATQKALAAGVPVCVVPFGRDQLETAARVVHAGAGSRLPVKRLSAERLRAAVRDAATKRAGAERCAAGFVAAGGATAGADVVEELVGASVGRADVVDRATVRPRL